MEEGKLLVTLIIAGVLQLILFYFIIRSAVRSANSELVDSLQKLLRLKMAELEKGGITREDILKPEIQIKVLENQFEKGTITYQELLEKRQEIEKQKAGFFN